MKEAVTEDTEVRSFTREYKIELPYMYVLAWDLPNLLEQYDDRNKKIEHQKSYTELLPGNTRIHLNYLSKIMLDVLLNEYFSHPTRLDSRSNKIIKIKKAISFSELLPTIEDVEKEYIISL